MVNLDQSLNWFFSQPQFFLPIFIWISFWKGFALWKAAGKKQLTWFIILFLINTLGLVEIAYIFYLNRWELGSSKLLALIKKKGGGKK